MEDIEAAYLTLVAVAAADGGCRPCIQGCIDEAVHLHPELPWEEAINQIRPDSTAETLREAVVSSRKMLAEGGFPESREVRVAR